MGGSKKKSAVQPVAQVLQTTATKSKAPSPLQQVTNASASLEMGAKMKKKADESISNVERLKRLEAKIDALTNLITAFPRTNRDQNLDVKVARLDKKIDRIESLLQTVLRNLRASQVVDTDGKTAEQILPSYQIFDDSTSEDEDVSDCGPPTSSSALVSSTSGNSQ